MNITYRKAKKADANLLIDIYNDAFYEDYIRYGECPAYGRTTEGMENSILRYPKLIIYNDDIPVGVISFENKGNGEYYIGCLCVKVAYQGNGIGTMAFKQMLSVCSDWKNISLITPADKEQNIKFYTRKCGMKKGDRNMDGNVEVITLYRQR